MSIGVGELRAIYVMAVMTPVIGCDEQGHLHAWTMWISS
jgi:hypothetical protein